MICQCGSKTKVLNTKHYKIYTWRRRECKKCKRRISSYELPANKIKAIVELVDTLPDNGNLKAKDQFCEDCVKDNCKISKTECEYWQEYKGG